MHCGAKVQPKEITMIDCGGKMVPWFFAPNASMDGGDPSSFVAFLVTSFSQLTLHLGDEKLPNYR